MCPRQGVVLCSARVRTPAPSSRAAKHSRSPVACNLWLAPLGPREPEGRPADLSPASRGITLACRVPWSPPSRHDPPGSLWPCRQLGGAAWCQTRESYTQAGRRASVLLFLTWGPARAPPFSRDARGASRRRGDAGRALAGRWPDAAGDRGLHRGGDSRKPVGIRESCVIPLLPPGNARPVTGP